MDFNGLTAFPSQINQLTTLRELSATDNNLAALPDLM
jgi:Leucine-rich repeat (LRR) protein